MAEKVKVIVAASIGFTIEVSPDYLKNIDDCCGSDRNTPVWMDEFISNLPPHKSPFGMNGAGVEINDGEVEITATDGSLFSY